jgi:hypothetical protein
MNLLTATGLRRSGVQFASGGRWEEAFSADDASVGAVERWLAAADRDVAVEALFCDAAGDLQGFMGFRRCLDETEDRITFWRGILAASKALETRKPEDNWKAWLKLLSTPSLLDNPADEIALGVFNKWPSAVPIVLRSERLTENHIAGGPDWVRQGSTAPICREYVWWKPERIWLADVVSHREGEGYFLDPNLLPL